MRKTNIPQMCVISKVFQNVSQKSMAPYFDLEKVNKEKYGTALSHMTVSPTVSNVPHG
jgi:hypothetical protein